MRGFVLIQLGDRLAIDVTLRPGDAYASLNDALSDEPDWIGSLYVAPFELDEREMSMN